MHTQITYKVITDRLVIRCFKPDDTEKVLRSINDSLNHLWPWIPWAQKEPFGFDEQLDRMRTFRGNFDLGKDFSFGIFNLKETECLGGTGLHPRVGKNAREIGYWIHQKHTGMGYASEAVSALTKIAFDIENLDRLEIHCAPDNVNSRRIPEKLGYTMEAILKKRFRNSDGELQDSMIWTLFKEDYENSDMKQTRIKAYDILNKTID